MLLAEVDGLGGDHDPHPVRWEDPVVVAKARTTAAIRSVGAPGFSRIVTVPTMISGPTVAGGTFRASGGATIIAAKSTVERQTV
jgi:hypothetical protein